MSYADDVRTVESFLGFGKKKITEEIFNQKYKNTMTHIFKECQTRLKVYCLEKKITSGISFTPLSEAQDRFSYDNHSYDIFTFQTDKFKRLEPNLNKRKREYDEFDEEISVEQYLFEKYVDPMITIVRNTINEVNGFDFECDFDGDKYDDGRVSLRFIHRIYQS